MVLQDLNLALSTLKPGLAELEPLVRPWSILGSSLAVVLGLSLDCPCLRPLFVLLQLIGESLVVALVLLLSWLWHWVVLGLSWVLW